LYRAAGHEGFKFLTAAPPKIGFFCIQFFFFFFFFLFVFFVIAEKRSPPLLTSNFPFAPHSSPIIAPGAGGTHTCRVKQAPRSFVIKVTRQVRSGKLIFASRILGVALVCGLKTRDRFRASGEM